MAFDEISWNFLLQYDDDDVLVASLAYVCIACARQATHDSDEFGDGVCVCVLKKQYNAILLEKEKRMAASEISDTYISYIRLELEHTQWSGVECERNGDIIYLM